MKVIVDCGLSPAFREFANNLQSEDVFVVDAPVLEGVVCTSQGGEAQRQRVNMARSLLCLDMFEEGDNILSCDPDTIFLREPDDFPFPSDDYDATIMPGTFIRGGKEIPTPWLRPDTLALGELEPDEIPHVEQHLHVEPNTLRKITSYNSGVVGFRVGRRFDIAWSDAYEQLRSTVTRDGQPVFAPFMIEQNALSLAIHLGDVRIEDLPRRFNFYPPIHPLPAIWPDDVVLVHFIGFRRNCLDDAYRIWFDTHRKLVSEGFLPKSIMFPSYLLPLLA